MKFGISRVDSLRVTCRRGKGEFFRSDVRFKHRSLVIDRPKVPHGITVTYYF